MENASHQDPIFRKTSRKPEPNLSGFVSREGALGRLLPLGAGLELSQVPVIIPLHFQIKHLRVPNRRRGDQPGIEQLQYPVTNPRQLVFDLGPVIADGRHVGLIAAALLLLLDGGDDAPRGAPRADHVLVGHREEVALLHGELLRGDQRGGDLLHEFHHLLVPLRLLGQLGHNSDGKIALCLAMGIRHLLNPLLPAGYYGNAFQSANAVLTGRDLNEWPLSRVAKMIKESKKVASDTNYI
ncbi:hypothetical protein RJ639_040854 [Escallonia herrerae]|uniref:Uncharacterized protein n=1 Tax=Escallonia herrerae TaxID=1293975 RepID=A0AA88WFC4_9ASTE|nr:hypothetical protein RJ639_040854 [Escallonia herrerae]